jgi:cytochrome P450
MTFLDIFDPAFRFEGPDVSAAQEQSWYADSPIGPVALRNREVSELLRDPRFRLGGEGYMELHGIEGGPLFQWWMHTLMSLEGMNHTRQRGLLAKAFTPRLVENLRPFTRATAYRLAAEIDPEESHDFIAEFADPLPALVMCELVGVPVEDYDQFHDWSGDIGLAFATGGLNGELLATVERAIEEMVDYIDGLIARRRKDPGSDLISLMIEASSDGGRLSTTELHDLTLLLVWAGQDTTSRQFGRALAAFGDYPDQWDLLCGHPYLLSNAVNEILRFTPQARMIQRYAMQDLSYGGLEFSANSVVFCCITSANRDPRAFENATTLDIRRKPSSRQLVFGGGIHHCLGHALAQMELEEGLIALTDRFGAPEVTGPIVWRPDLAMIHGPDSLPLSFAAQAPSLRTTA